MEPIVILSLFDGSATGYLALRDANIAVKRYYASEINEHAKKIGNSNFPEIIQIGDVRNLFYCNGMLQSYQYDWTEADVELKKQRKEETAKQELLLEQFLEERNKSQTRIIHVGRIDLLIGGSPCQDLSLAGRLLGLYGNTSSSLFWNFKRLLDEINPYAFLLENTKMEYKWRNVISNELDTTPILINSNLVSAQNRERLYWTNLPNPDIKCKNYTLKDILLPENMINKKYYISDKKIKEMLSEGRIKFPKNFNYNSTVGCAQRGRYIDKAKSKTKQFIEFRKDSYSNCLTTVKKDSLIYIGNNENDFIIRTLHPIEGERLQTLPDNFTAGVSETARWNIIGNGWTADIITEFFKNL